MTISLVILFGSRARGDAEDSSDTDLLLATKEAGVRHVTDGKLSLSFYSEEELRQGAANGDLFICHVVMEGRLLAGDSSDFREIQRVFRLRDNYGEEIAKASDLGRFLIQYGPTLGNEQLVNRRLAWVARTILIARSAESGRPVFSPKALASWSGAPEIETLISNRYSVEPFAQSLAALDELLKRWGDRHSKTAPASTSSYRKHFAKTGNAVALKTLDWRARSSEGVYL